jgi:hypothetical protein
MIDSVFLGDTIREKHRNAPLFAERDSYLTHLLQNGCRRRSVRNVASMLLMSCACSKWTHLGPWGWMKSREVVNGGLATSMLVGSAVRG